MTAPTSMSMGPAQPRPPIYRRGPSWVVPVLVIVAIIAVGLMVNLARDGGNNTPASQAQATTTTVAGNTTTTVAGPTTTQATTPTTVTAPATTVPTLAGTGTLPAAKATYDRDGWKITDFGELDSNPIVKDWMVNKLRKPAPELWPTFPNVPNPKVPEFRVVDGKQVPDGVEYGQDQSPFCANVGNRCDIIVPAWHYRVVSGDYSFQGVNCQQATAGQGCAYIVFCVSEVSCMFRNQSVDNGFTVMGRYWNGDKAEWAAWGLSSHVSANMLGYPTMRNPLTGDVLNAGGSSSNAGANCGNPRACSQSVNMRIFVAGGDHLISMAEIVVNR